MNAKQILDDLNYVCRHYPKKSFELSIMPCPDERKYHKRFCYKPMPREIARLILGKNYAVELCAAIVGRSESRVRDILRMYCWDADQELYQAYGLGRPPIKYFRAHAAEFLSPQPTKLQRIAHEIRQT